jgi:hypothetical protein
VNKYEVTFRFETSTTVEIEAETEDEARALARKEMDDMGVDRLPEMWPEDFELARVWFKPAAVTLDEM